MFQNLKIKFNNNNDIRSLNYYPLLCYYIFYFSVIIIKFKLWQFEDNNNNFDFLKVKIIIHTFIDMINVLCDNSKLNTNYILNQTVTLFYFKQSNFLLDKNILDIIEEKQSKKINYDKTKNVIKIIKNKLLPINLENKLNYFSLLQNKYICKNYINYSNLKKVEDNLILFSNKEMDDIYNILKYDFYKKIIINFDINYESRTFKLTNESLNKISKNKQEQIIDDYFKFKDNILINKYKLNKSLYLKEQKINEKINLLIKNYKNVNYNIYLEFINNLKNLFNNNIYIENTKLFIFNDQYILNHDINGNNLEKNIYLPSKNGKIINNHSIFKQDVLEITNDKYYLYYNLYNHLYLGFKDNKNIILNKKGKYLIINYSLRNLLLLIGLDSKYHNIADKKNINEYIYNKQKKFV